MPEMGEDVEGADLTAWLKNEGDKVQYDDDLLEVTTDKAVFCIPAPATGIISKILVKEGEKAPIDTILCIIDEE